MNTQFESKDVGYGTGRSCLERLGGCFLSGLPWAITIYGLYESVTSEDNEFWLGATAVGLLGILFNLIIARMKN